MEKNQQLGERRGRTEEGDRILVKQIGILFENAKQIILRIEIQRKRERVNTLSKRHKKEYMYSIRKKVILNYSKVG